MGFGWVFNFVVFIFCLMIVLIGVHGYSESEPCSSALILSRYFADTFGSLLDLLS